MKNLTLNLYRITSRFFLRSEFDRLLAASMFFGSVLSVLRVIHTGRINFIFMIWNLFLGYIPYAISTWLTLRAEKRGALRVVWSVARTGDRTAEKDGRAVGMLLVTYVPAFVWLLFIPNSFYMLTDLFHLSDNYRDIRVPQWYDLILILSFALNGLLLGFISLRHMEKLFVPKDDKWKGILFLYPVLFLSALGVYVGRYWRYNSWNIITNPFRLIFDIAHIIVHPLQNAHVWGMVVCFTLLLSFVYRLMKKVSAALI